MTQYVDFQEELLIEGCRRSDRKYQEQLYRKYADEMYIVCLAYEKDRDAVKDILQDAFVKVFRNIGNYNRKGSFKGWIRRIVVNTAIDHFRLKNNHLNNDVDIETIADYTPDRINDPNNTNAKDILRMVERLPEGARIIFNLFALEGFSHKEIAEQLNISEGTSKSQYSRARQLLQERFES